MGILRKIRRKGGSAARKELRLGNFTVCVTDDRISFRDINDTVSHSVSLLTPKGQVMDTLVSDWQDGNENAETLLTYYVSTMMNVLSCIPFTTEESGMDYMDGLNKLTARCVLANAGLYGLDGEIDDEEDRRILDELRKVQEEIEQ